MLLRWEGREKDLRRWEVARQGNRLYMGCDSARMTTNGGGSRDSNVERFVMFEAGSANDLLRIHFNVFDLCGISELVG